MGRRVIAILASMMLLCAAVLGVAMPPPGGALPHVPWGAVVDHDDGMALEDSVIDDLRPSALQDSPFGAVCLDQLPAESIQPAWRLTDGVVSWARADAERLPPWPYLGPPVRPPSA